MRNVGSRITSTDSVKISKGAQKVRNKGGC